MNERLMIAFGTTGGTLSAIVDIMSDTNWVLHVVLGAAIGALVSFTITRILRIIDKIIQRRLDNDK